MNINIRISPCRCLFLLEVQKSVIIPCKAKTEKIDTHRKRETSTKEVLEKVYQFILKVSLSGDF